jgi:hypothetical protein
MELTWGVFVSRRLVECPTDSAGDGGACVDMAGNLVTCWIPCAPWCEWICGVSVHADVAEVEDRARETGALAVEHDAAAAAGGVFCVAAPTWSCVLPPDVHRV